jgi:hypothetical protein
MGKSADITYQTKHAGPFGTGTEYVEATLKKDGDTYKGTGPDQQTAMGAVLTAANTNGDKPDRQS